MGLFDIMQVEDAPDERRLTGRYAEKQGLSYLGLSCLQSLETALPTSSARIFVVDGNFPKIDDGPILPLAPDAIALIRQHYPGSKIVLYSSEEAIAELAKQNEVEFRSKRDFTARAFVDELKAMLE